MHDIKWILDNPEAFDAGLARRGLSALSAQLLALDKTRRDAIVRLQTAQERRNAASREIGQAMARKDTAAAEALKAEVAQIKTDFPNWEQAERDAVMALHTRLSEIPNLPLADVPLGKDENDNVEVRRHGTIPEFSFKPQEHFELGEALGMMDFEAASRMSGARFVVNKGALARLERALGQFMLDIHTAEHGYTEVNPPILVRDDAMFGTAQLPKFREDQFRAGDEFWLIPTAEVPLTNLAREQILDEVSLPHRYTALTPCFRAEAGSAGRDTRGMIRQHQFNKVELVSITRPEESDVEHARLTRCAETVLEKLGLPYRTVLLCTGDMGFASQKTYDIEVWLPGQGRYREISSCSTCGDFQARRMNARFRDAGAKTPRFVHTLNGSGIAVGRALVAVMENYQNQDGSITVPAALLPYMGGVTQISSIQK
ncbi:MAG: serine--tRNA ligase [Hyphomicrobiales bacterium]|nr:serine--tRNA ligase [Hyphomicrobiales bacterium]MDE2113936.1 serine--tRNA ligase [Hyphomicrobiales bacterium]